MVLGEGGVLLLGIGSLADKAIKLIYNHSSQNISTINNAIKRFFSWKNLRILFPVMFFSGMILNYQNIASWVTTGRFSTHWVYIVAGGYLVLLGITCFILGLIDYIFDLIYERMQSSNM
jgi:hypothetical protein